MIKVKSSIEITIDEKVYQLLCDSDAPLGAVHDALTQMRSIVVDKIVALDKSKEEKPEGAS